nr:hypothetical protein [Alphaproteobacteria bacterium]
GLAESSAGLGIDLGEAEDIEAMVELDVAAADAAEEAATEEAAAEAPAEDAAAETPAEDATEDKTEA